MKHAPQGTFYLPYPSFLFLFLKVWTIFKVSTEFAVILLLFNVLEFGPKAYGFLGPQQRMEPTPPALEGKVITAGSPKGSPLFNSFYMFSGVFMTCLPMYMIVHEYGNFVLFSFFSFWKGT